MFAHYATGLKELLSRAAPEIPAYRLLLRLAAWKACKLARARPVVRVHARSRMRLDARPGEHGIRAGIFLYRDGYEPSVRNAIDRHRKGLDASPVTYLSSRNRPLQNAARAAAGEYFGVKADDVALVESTTSGIGLL